MAMPRSGPLLVCLAFFVSSASAPVPTAVPAPPQPRVRSHRPRPRPLYSILMHGKGRAVYMVDGQVAPEPLRAEACHVQGDRAIHPQAQDSALDPAMIIEMLRHFQGENTLLSDDEMQKLRHHAIARSFPEAACVPGTFSRKTYPPRTSPAMLPGNRAAAKGIDSMPREDARIRKVDSVENGRRFAKTGAVPRSLPHSEGGGTYRRTYVSVSLASDDLACDADTRSGRMNHEQCDGAGRQRGRQSAFSSDRRSSYLVGDPGINNLGGASVGLKQEAASISDDAWGGNAETCWDAMAASVIDTSSDKRPEPEGQREGMLPLPLPPPSIRGLQQTPKVLEGVFSMDEVERVMSSAAARARPAGRTRQQQLLNADQDGGWTREDWTQDVGVEGSCSGKVMGTMSLQALEQRMLQGVRQASADKTASRSAAGTLKASADAVCCGREGHPSLGPAYGHADPVGTPLEGCGGASQDHGGAARGRSRRAIAPLGLGNAPKGDTCGADLPAKPESLSCGQAHVGSDARATRPLSEKAVQSAVQAADMPRCPERKKEAELHPRNGVMAAAGARSAGSHDLQHSLMQQNPHPRAEGAAGKGLVGLAACNASRVPSSNPWARREERTAAEARGVKGWDRGAASGADRLAPIIEARGDSEDDNFPSLTAASKATGAERLVAGKAKQVAVKAVRVTGFARPGANAGSCSTASYSSVEAQGHGGLGAKEADVVGSRRVGKWAQVAASQASAVGRGEVPGGTGLMQHLFTSVRTSPNDVAGVREGTEALNAGLSDDGDEASEALWRLKAFHARLEVISAGKR